MANLMQVSHKAQYGDFLMISYEGADIGPIKLFDLIGSLDKDYDMTLLPGTFVLVKRTEVVDNALTMGALKIFSNPLNYDGNPPIWTYRCTWFI